MRRKHFKIYQTSWHLATTLLFICVPFVFLLLFSNYTHIAREQLMYDVATSFVRLVISYVIAVILAWIFAVWCFRGKLSAILLPLFDVLQSFPTFAALPLAAFFWGVSNLTVIFFLVITIIWPIFFSIVSSLKLVKHDWEEAVAILGLSGSVYFRKFLLPVSIPGLITGSIIGLGEGWEALVATEIIVGLKSSLGSFFQAYSQNVQITFLGIFGFLLLIFSMNKLVWLPLLDWSHRYMEE